MCSLLHFVYSLLFCCSHCQGFVALHRLLLVILTRMLKPWHLPLPLALPLSLSPSFSLCMCVCFCFNLGLFLVPFVAFALFYLLFSVWNINMCTIFAAVNHYVLSILGDVNILYNFYFSLLFHLELCVGLTDTLLCASNPYACTYFIVCMVDNVCAFSIKHNLCHSFFLSLSLPLAHGCWMHQWIELFCSHHSPMICSPISLHTMTFVHTHVAAIQPQWR